MHSVRQRIWTLACNKGIGFIALSMKKNQRFSQWLENVPNNCWATVPLYRKNDLNKNFSNAIYAYHGAKLEKIFACGGRECSFRS